MLLFICKDCGHRIITFEKQAEPTCTRCGADAEPEAGLTIKIRLGMEEFPELRLETQAGREDLVRITF